MLAAPGEDVPDEEITWPEQDPQERAGRHRLHTDDWFCYRLETALALRAHRERRPVAPLAPPSRVDIRLPGALL
ncbi:hypothetical protein ABZ805_22925 [Saccharopolyspora sp. NPDC047091]|uniref:hypothetical protein n=1 Tax=Saccharopolyspora sp. NPDC047091 TaxID=3155924 RepID=UPI0034080334